MAGFVAEHPFARPFGVPDGYIGALYYGLIAALAIAPLDLKFTGILFSGWRRWRPSPIFWV